MFHYVACKMAFNYWQQQARKPSYVSQLKLPKHYSYTDAKSNDCKCHDSGWIICCLLLAKRSHRTILREQYTRDFNYGYRQEKNIIRKLGSARKYANTSIRKTLTTNINNNDIALFEAGELVEIETIIALWSFPILVNRLPCESFEYYLKSFPKLGKASALPFKSKYIGGQ